MNNCDSIPTRQSLLVRLKDWGDQESWREFFELYWRLLHATALKAGLTEVEAQEVVQEVMIAVAKKMPGFTYDPGKDSLKGWLLGVTRWKVADQFRKRKRAGEASQRGDAGQELPRDQDSVRTATVDRVPDPNSIDLEAIWDGEWRENLLRAALDRIKLQVNPAHYEMYHLHAVQGLSPRDTAIALAVSAAAVHMANYRVGRLVKAEIRRLTNPSPL
ncbi:MAG: rna polymerase sigma factor region 2 [Verrucomicrobiales bacterium]|nr:rna polymerase sigma factor region 2 [Verrucomicrobiales bacterium]